METLNLESIYHFAQPVGSVAFRRWFAGLECGPFTTAGIFHIYCTIHQGMNLTIVVQ
jgi:hypothetical protein